MTSIKVLQDILQQPLGPYYEHDILHKDNCQMHNGTQLVLYSFVLEHNGRVTGLDKSETPIKQDTRRFRFRGILKIADPSWLSELGLTTVEKELNLRACERVLREGGRTPPLLTLEELFQRQLLRPSRDATWRKEGEVRLMVLVQGEKSYPAVFMHSTLAPDGLLWMSKAHNRKYQIATMDVETYARSENFFWRWRLLALMEKIGRQYAFIPPRKRTPIWFVEKYMERFACPDEDKFRRLIGDENDSDVKQGRIWTPRHLLKPHTSEILGLFAAYAEWLITNTEARNPTLLDITSWENFAREARRERKEAARLGIKWGRPVQGEPEEEFSEEDDDDSVEGTDEMVRRNPVIGKANEVVTRKIERARIKGGRDTKPIVSSGSGSEGEAVGVAAYLSDFSEPEDAEEDDSDAWLGEEDAVSRIPWELLQPPLLPDVDGRWWCPLEECDHHIDLHNLRPEERRGLPEEITGYIMQKQWRNAAYDNKVLLGFEYMVTNHYIKHFRQRGVTLEKRDGKSRFTFVNGRQRRRGVEEPIRGPMPARGTLGGESRVVPIVHAPQAGYLQ